MIKNKKQAVSISLTKKDRLKIDAIATASEVSRSEAVRSLIRGKRVKKNSQKLAGKNSYLTGVLSG
jgi:metal-responsive CopG/Arc/MetJ family transcriptional regulator